MAVIRQRAFFFLFFPLQPPLAPVPGFCVDRTDQLAGVCELLCLAHVLIFHFQGYRPILNADSDWCCEGGVGDVT